MDSSEIVKKGYDKIAVAYLDNRARLKSGKYVQLLLKYLPKNSSVLDLGCGAGVPVDDLLLKAGHEVVGIDISSEQIKLAKKNCPRGDYVVGNIEKLAVGDYQVDAVVSLYAIFHSPRVMHGKILKVIASCLKKRGYLLITMGDREFEGLHTLHGVEMWSSQYGTVKNKELVERAGFKIVFSDIDNSGGERHLVIMAQKP